MCSLYHLDTYKRDNILLKVYKGESRERFTNLLHTSHEIDDAHDWEIYSWAEEQILIESFTETNIAKAEVFSPWVQDHSWLFLPWVYCSHIDLIILAWSFQNQWVLIYLWKDQQVPRSPCRVQITLYGKGSCIWIMKAWKRFLVGVFGKPLHDRTWRHYD